MPAKGSEKRRGRDGEEEEEEKRKREHSRIQKSTGQPGAAPKTKGQRSLSLSFQPRREEAAFQHRIAK